jgi:ABC-type nitrate/sulfonate/bicarbonate transport system permease component
VTRYFPQLIGVVAVAAVWELLGRLHAFGTEWPPLSAVVAYIAAPGHHDLLVAAIVRTGGEAIAGLVIGSIVAILLASLSVLVPPAAAGLGAFASIVNGIPIIAVAGICVLTLPRDATPVVVAALAVAFIVFVAATAALSSSSATLRDLFAVLGASHIGTFMRLNVPGALPGTLDGVRSAAPAAVVGAIVGEWFAAEHGLGPLLVAAMQNYEIDQLWAAALAGTLLAMAIYGVLGAVRGVVSARSA